MTIDLPQAVEQSIRAAVRAGQFESPDQAVAAAWQAFERSSQVKRVLPPISNEELIRRLSTGELPGLFPGFNPDEEDDEPITIEGEPLSETVVRERQTLAEKSATPIWEIIDQLRAKLPPDALDGVPEDGARQMDHYLYGTPKRPAS